MISDFIFPMVKMSLRILVLVLIAHICSEFNYAVSYHKAWLAKQKALDKMHSK